MIRRHSKSRVALWEEEDGKDENGKTLEMGGKALEQISPGKKNGFPTWLFTCWLMVPFT